MNLYLELNKPLPHHNTTRPRVRQGEHRAAKSRYRPAYMRAPHHQPAKVAKE